MKKELEDDSKIKMQDVEEEDDFDYDLDGDFDDLWFVYLFNLLNFLMDKVDDK